jgi:PAS domain S-box-containing protein
MSPQTLPAQAEQLFRYLFEQASVGIALEDLEGKLLLANPALCSMLGYTEKELCDMSCSQFASPEDSQDDWALFQRLRAGLIDQYSLEKRYVRKDAAQLWGRLNVSILKNGDGGSSHLVFAFVEDITERKRAEEVLRESEERLRLAAHAGKMLAYEWDATTDKIVRSEGVTQILGEDEPTHTTGQHILSMIPPEDREKLNAAVAQLSPEKPYLQIRYRMIRSDGNVIWVDRSSRAYFDEQGRMLRMVGMLADITERKLAEEVLASVSRRLIEAQERERTRIARELHDDVGQRLALLNNELERLRQDFPDLGAEVHARIGALRKQTDELATDVQSMSHELHSSKLEYLGLLAAMTGFCKEFSEQQKVEIVFIHDEIPSGVPHEISLCLFRVLQEALQNAVKHSGVRHFDVKLQGSPAAIHLTVRDSGVGFDPALVRATQGLGLVSMQERVRLVKGTISITSRPQSDTVISVHVPLSAGTQTGLSASTGA